MIYHQFCQCEVFFTRMGFWRRLWLMAAHSKDFQITFDPPQFPYGLPAPLVYKIKRTARRLWDDHRLDYDRAIVKPFSDTKPEAPCN